MTKVFPLLLMAALFFQCTPKNACPTVKAERIIRDIQESSPDYRLNIYVTPSLLLINGAKVAKIDKGKLSNENDESVYAPLIEAIYSEFKVRGDDPYREILVHAHEKLPKRLLRKIQSSALSTHLAPVILIPVDYHVTTCTYKKSKVQKKGGPPLTIKNNILIRQEKGRILVDGKVVVTITNDTLPEGVLDKRKILILPLLKALSARLAKLPEAITPVLHITFDAKLSITRYILITAGKAGIFKLKTVRVLPQ